MAMGVRGLLDPSTSEILGTISELEATPLSTAISVYSKGYLRSRLLFSQIFVLSIGKVDVSITVRILFGSKMSSEGLYAQWVAHH